MIAIDALTVSSGRVNVLVVEDEVPDPVIHEMKLLPSPFSEMKRGRKTVEMRLFDEKRKKLRPGDKIVFTNTDTAETLEVTVVGLHCFDSFRALAEAFPVKALGVPELSAPQIADVMSGIYGVDEIKKYGTLAIRVSLNNGRY